MSAVLIAALYFTIGYSTHKLQTTKRKRAMRAHPAWFERMERETLNGTPFMGDKA
jgi:hypothetical protein